MGLLTKDQILLAQDLETVTVSVPEWGGDVTLSTMSGAARDRYDASIYKSDASGVLTVNSENMRAKFVAASIVDESGDLMFSDEEVSALSTKSVAALDRLYEEATKLNGVGIDAVEEKAKNS